MELRVARTDDLDGATLAALRELLDAAFEGERPSPARPVPSGFSDDDWAHARGGVHFIRIEDDEIVAHAAVVPRALETNGRMWRTGYVEAVATRPDVQRRGHGTVLMRAAGEYIRTAYELGSLSTGEDDFYERLGWQLWRGETGVRTDGGVQMTPWENGTVMVLLTDASAHVDLTGTITCEWRPGDVW